jgi:carboxylesterase type B
MHKSFLKIRFFLKGWDDTKIVCNGHVCHGSDLPYTFGTAGPYNFTSIGKQISLSRMFYWSNFTSINSTSTLWPAYDLKKKTYLRFVSPENRIENSYLKSECDFFDKIGYYF